jgi:hypothetical protein
MAGGGDNLLATIQAIPALGKAIFPSEPGVYGVYMPLVFGVQAAH